jgi:hypothetical protein
MDARESARKSYVNDHIQPSAINPESGMFRINPDTPRMKKAISKLGFSPQDLKPLFNHY